MFSGKSLLLVNLFVKYENLFLFTEWCSLEFLKIRMLVKSVARSHATTTTTKVIKFQVCILKVFLFLSLFLYLLQDAVHKIALWFQPI